MGRLSLIDDWDGGWNNLCFRRKKSQSAHYDDFAWPRAQLDALRLATRLGQNDQSVDGSQNVLHHAAKVVRSILLRLMSVSFRVTDSSSNGRNIREHVRS
jgi:hypothetical protein